MNQPNTMLETVFTQLCIQSFLVVALNFVLLHVLINWYYCILHYAVISVLFLVAGRRIKLK
jgi:membrane protein implicated in regulation of membrane protease activity